MRIITGLSLICLAMLVASGGLVLVQRLMPTRRRMPHNDVAGFIYAVLGVRCDPSYRWTYCKN
jgi:hypothetical protein